MGQEQQPTYSKELAIKGNKSNSMPRMLTLPCGILPSDLQIINPELPNDSHPSRLLTSIQAS